MNPYQPPISMEAYSRNKVSRLRGLFLLVPVASYLHRLTWDFDYALLMFAVIIAISGGLIAFSHNLAVVKASLIMARVCVSLYVAAILVMEIVFRPYHGFWHFPTQCIVGIAFVCGAFLPPYPRCPAELESKKANKPWRTNRP